MAGSRKTKQPSRVHVQIRADTLEVYFERGFRNDDLNVIRAIPGRWYAPARRLWIIPRTETALQIIERSLGDRVVWSDTASVRTAEPSVADDPAPAPGISPSEIDETIRKVRERIQLREYSHRTEVAYVSWTQRFLMFHARDHSVGTLTAAHVNRFLEHLTKEERLAAKSRNQAASALTFLFREILQRDDALEVTRAKGPSRLPVVLSHREVLLVLRQLTGRYFLIATLMYSAGLRIQECLRLRVKDIDFELRQILVRDGKGRKDRYVPLARRATHMLRAQTSNVAELHEADLAAGRGWAPLPAALHRKDPSAGYTLAWQWVFPASGISTDPATGRLCRFPLHASAVQREVKQAVRRSGITKRATCHTLRHSFATEALRGGCDIRMLQHLMGHRDIRTTMIYLHVVEQTGLYIRSPLDRPDDPEDMDDELIGPRPRVTEQWDLAARQWNPPKPKASSQKPPRARPDRSNRPRPKK